MQHETINSYECQFASLKGIAEGDAKAPPTSFIKKVKLAIRRHLTPRQDKILSKKLNVLIDWYYKIIRKKPFTNPKLHTDIYSEPLKAGDLVRVKSKEEIEATLNHLGQSRGCGFMADVMTPYCNTVQRVLKPMERFVDERDLRVKKCKGLILLEGVMCEGTTAFGRCDRSCFLFWREEWLEKIE